MRKRKGPIFGKYLFTRLNSLHLPLKLSSVRSNAQFHSISGSSQNAPHDILMSLRMPQTKLGEFLGLPQTV